MALNPLYRICLIYQLDFILVRLARHLCSSTPLVLVIAILSTDIVFNMHKNNDLH